MATTTVEENKRVVRRLPEEVANGGDLEVLAEVFAEDYVDHTPMGDLQGLAAARDLFEQVLAAFPDRTVTVENLVAQGDTVAIRVRWQATHEGAYLGIEPTGREVEFTVAEFYRIGDGKIVERWLLPDQFGLLQQLGAVEAPTG